jgi:hypothetical protein
MRSTRVRKPARTFLLGLLATVALTLGITGVAMAATVTDSGNVVTFNAAGGEANNIGWNYDTSGGTFIDVTEFNSKNTLTSDGSCSANGTNSFRCPVSGGAALVVNLGDNDDSAGGAFLGAPLPADFSVTEGGGDGNDTLTGDGANVNNAAKTTMNGDAGTDTLRGTDGDTLNGGDGNDNLATDNFGAPTPNSGVVAQGTTENGGNGDDSLGGSRSTSAADQLNGGAGNDSLGVGAGNENVVGGDGIDNAFFTTGNAGGVSASLDNVANDGRPNGQAANIHSDVEDLFGTGGADLLTGAPGPSNFIDGNGGNDTFNTASNPPDPDHIVCGDGFVTINGDIADSFSATGANACNGRITAGPAAVGPTIAVNPSRVKLTKTHGAPLKVTCAAAVGVCRGAVEVDDTSGNVLGTASFIIPNAKTKTVTVQLNTAILQGRGFAKILARQAVSAARKKKAKSKTMKAVVTVDATDNANRAVTTVTKKVTLVGKKKRHRRH